MHKHTAAAAAAAAEKPGLLPKIYIKTNFMTAVPEPKAGVTISNLIHNSAVDAHTRETEFISIFHTMARESG